MGKYSVFRSVPPEERAEIVDVEAEKVKYSLMNFFNDIKRKSTQYTKFY